MIPLCREYSADADNVWIVLLSTTTRVSSNPRTYAAYVRGYIYDTPLTYNADHDTTTTQVDGYT